MSAANFQEQVRRGILFPKGVLDYSGPGLMSPGETVEMWLKVDPGEYVLICWEPFEVGTGPCFFRAISDSGGFTTSADVVLRLMDYRFEFEGKLHKGEQVIRVETRGPSMHEADLFRLHAGKTVADIRRWRKEDLQVAPADALGGPLDSTISAALCGCAGTP